MKNDYISQGEIENLNSLVIKKKKSLYLGLAFAQCCIWNDWEMGSCF